MPKLIFTSLKFRDDNIRLSALLDDAGRPIIFDIPGRTPTLVGSIYVGRVSSIVPEIGAAFIEYAPGRKAFFPLDEPEGIFVKRNRPGRLTAGDELLIEITKEQSGEKAASASSVLTFKNDCLLLSTANSAKGISKKITDPEKRRELRAWVQERKTDAGVIVRTKAAVASSERLEKSYAELVAAYDDVIAKTPHLVPFSVLRAPKRDELYLIESIRNVDIDEAVTDDKELFSVLTAADLAFPVRLYDGSLPMEKAYSLETRLEEALGRKVYMKSGAFLYIEPTQAMTVIDVNSGKNNSDPIYVNLEAAHEIVRQLTLRNISGIIVVDFINMKGEEEYSSLRAELENICLSYPGGICFVGFTGLGLCELTRKKTRKPLAEQIACP